MNFSFFNEQQLRQHKVIREILQKFERSGVPPNCFAINSDELTELLVRFVDILAQTHNQAKQGYLVDLMGNLILSGEISFGMKQILLRTFSHISIEEIALLKAVNEAGGRLTIQEISTKHDWGEEDSAIWCESLAQLYLLKPDGVDRWCVTFLAKRLLRWIFEEKA